MDVFFHGFATLLSGRQPIQAGGGGLSPPIASSTAQKSPLRLFHGVLVYM
jgi:hypothetical protein